MMRLSRTPEADGDAHLEPLTTTRPLSDCWVASCRFGDWPKRAALQAGLEWSDDPPGPEDGRLLANAWISPGMLERLASASPPVLVKGDVVLASPPEAVAGRAKRVDVGDEGHLIRYPWDFLAVQEDFLSNIENSDVHQTARLHEGATLDGVVLVGPGSVILPGVYIEGVAIIGRNCKIGPNAYLRGMNSIGDGCHIGQAVEVKNSILYPNTTIGHLSYCGDSIVGEGVNFGAGTIVSNFRHDGKNHRSMIGDQLVDTGRRKFGAVIGDGVHTGIHTSIYPGRKLWPHTSTRPGDIVQRDLR